MSEYESKKVHRYKEFTNKKKLFETLALLLSEGEGPTFHRVLDNLNAREKLGTTYIGKGVAIPHCKLPIESPKAVILRLDEMLKYADDSVADVDIIFGLLVPEDSAEQHLHILSTIAKLCERDGWLDGLRELETEQDMINYILNTDTIIESNLADIL